MRAPTVTIATLLLASTAPFGCSGDGSAEAASGTDTEGPSEPVEAPVFLQPASGAIAVHSARTDDVILRVDRIVPGTTRFVLDARSYGGLVADPQMGSLNSEALTLHARGAMLSARHRFFLETPSVDEPARSAEIEVEIFVDSTPSVTASLDPAVALTGRSILSQGIGEEAVLLVYDEASGPVPRIHAYRGQGDRWDLRTPVSIPVTAMDLDGGAPPFCASLRTRGTDEVGDDRLRLAWRHDATQIRFVDRAWTTAAASTQTALRLEQLDTEGFQFASLGRPTLVGELLLVETNLIRDTQSPRPGDRRLTAVPLRGEPAEVGSARSSAPLGVTDIDQVGPAIDFATLSVEPDRRPRAIAARIHGSRAAVFDVDTSTGILRLRGDSSELGGWQRSRRPVTAVLGAFGSRTMLGLTDAHAVVQTFDDAGETAATDASVPLVGSTMLDVAETPAVSVIGGYPIAMIPMGPDHPVMVLAIAGSRVDTSVLESLRCDQIALAASDRALRGTSAGFACRSGEDIRLGTIALAFE